jgi:hypothetical protein
MNRPAGMSSDPLVSVPGASAEEIAAVVAALTSRGNDRPAVASPYERWRRTRLGAIASRRTATSAVLEGGPAEE